MEGDANMIPKVIHYCWFGGKPLPEDIRRYMMTWRKVLPDYKIVRWSEKNFDISTAPDYVKEAYEAKKYAFVADYVRVKELADHGGVYFDTDIEAVKDFSQYLEGKCVVLGFESERLLTTAFIACKKHDPFISEFEQSYHTRHFVMDNGELDLTNINDVLSEFAETKGLDLDRDEYQELPGGIAVYPKDYFAAWDVHNWHPKTTERTCTVHHMASSWIEVSKADKLKGAMMDFTRKVFGDDFYDALRAKLKGKKQ